MACSGGYWIAAAADTIVVSDAALLGSIGVVLGVRPKGPDDKTIEFVSSQSPGKRPDPGSKDGQSQIQTMVDDLAEVFVSAVAKYRNVSVEDVITKFGAGGIKVGAKAVASGMADQVGQFEALLSSLATSGVGRFPSSIGVITMSTTTTGPTADEIAAQARTEAAARMKAITTSDDGKASPTLAQFLAYDTFIPAADATKILSAAKADWPKASEPPATPPAPPATTAPPPVDPAAAYLAQQATAGALGLAKPE
jgi:ClpP class serine protease